FPQSAGSNVIPGGRGWGAKSLGSMPVGAVSVTWNGGPKLDRTFLTLAMSAWDRSGSADWPVPHAARTPAHVMTGTALGLNIAVNVPAGPRSTPQCRQRFDEQCRGEILSEWRIRRSRVGDNGHESDVVTEIRGDRVGMCVGFGATLEDGRRRGAHRPRRGSVDGGRIDQPDAAARMPAGQRPVAAVGD